jgi:hypothetical protein
MLKEEREYNLPRLKKVREMIDAGELPHSKRKEFWVKNDLWKYKWVCCIGVQCKIKAMSTKHECPLEPTKEGCWWVYAHEWRKDYERKRKGQAVKSIMRKKSEA